MYKKIALAAFVSSAVVAFTGCTEQQGETAAEARAAEKFEAAVAADAAYVTANPEYFDEPAAEQRQGADDRFDAAEEAAGGPRTISELAAEGRLRGVPQLPGNTSTAGTPVGKPASAAAIATARPLSEERKRELLSQ